MIDGTHTRPAFATCARPSCVSRAEERVAAAGTNAHRDVCYEDIRWAKTAILRDFPAHTVTRQTLNP